PPHIISGYSPDAIITPTLLSISPPTTASYSSVTPVYSFINLPILVSLKSIVPLSLPAKIVYVLSGLVPNSPYFEASEDPSSSEPSSNSCSSPSFSLPVSLSLGPHPTIPTTNNTATRKKTSIFLKFIP